jgi:formylmethanofuran dehydrogenase subunit C
MTAGTAMIFGTVHRMLPTFRHEGTKTESYGDNRVLMRIYRGDVANRGKGILLVRDTPAYGPGTGQGRTLP